MQYRPNVSSFLPKNGHFYAHAKHRNSNSGVLFPPLSPMLTEVTQQTRPRNIRPIRGRRINIPSIDNRPSLAETITNSLEVDVYRLPVSLMDVVKCPIEYVSLSKPIITPSGITYNRPAISKWLTQEKSIDPSTKKKCLESELRENKIVLKLLQLIDSIEKANDAEKETFYTTLVSLFYNSKGELITNPVVNRQGDTEQSQAANPEYKNHVFLDVMSSEYIQEIMRKVNEKKDKEQTQTLSAKSKAATSVNSEKILPTGSLGFWSKLTAKDSDSFESGKRITRNV